MTERRETVRAYVSMWNERRYDRIPELVTDSFVLHDPTAPEDGVPGPDAEVHGPDGLRQFIELATTGFPDFEIEVIELTAEDGCVVYEGRHGGTHEGEFAGLPPTDRSFRVRHASTFRFAEEALSASPGRTSTRRTRSNSSG